MSVLNGPEVICLDRPYELTLADEAAQGGLCCLILEPWARLDGVKSEECDAMNGPASRSLACPPLL